MDRTTKKQMVGEIKETFSDVMSIVLADYRGVDVPTVTAMRDEFREAGCGYRVLKNTLIKVAIKDSEMEPMSAMLAGPTAVIWSNDSPTAPAKIAVKWAKEAKPIHPVLSCWDDNEATDIVNAHNYRWSAGGWDRQADMNPKKGTVFTEAGARWYAPRPSNGEPCEVIHWLEKRRAAKKSTPGVYLCWELMVGNSNCRWYWGTKHGAPEPTVPKSPRKTIASTPSVA